MSDKFDCLNTAQFLFWKTVFFPAEIYAEFTADKKSRDQSTMSERERERKTRRWCGRWRPERRRSPRRLQIDGATGTAAAAFENDSSLVFFAVLGEFSGRFLCDFPAVAEAAIYGSL